jgi:TolA-binding protein
MMATRLVFAAVLLLFAAMPARAQIDSREGIALRNQILQLQSEVDQLRKQVESGAGAGNQGSALGGRYSQPATPLTAGSNDLVATLLQEVSSLQDQVRELHGQVDELSNKVDRQVADLGKKVDDLQFQFQLVQGKAPGTASLPGAPASAAPAVRPPPEVMLRQGQAALARSDYAAAASAAEAVLQADPHSPRAYDAEFLLAEALFGQRQYTRAALAYDDAYGRSPSGSHSQDSLLGLARALAAINQKPAACAALSKLHQQFPTLRSDIAPAAATLAHQTGCS